eukprot:CAMPEP_0194715080 /NCGR_PEP_ID=MMETSP0296-20130528/6768_1 /TAXON_ID=39354 /ORGANISM="Heterosigma akashiwo, Strain CCMP2393" /LENGTH=37 /DNA_ID= /DNA_START= /DNA_END= /DNA_ORIENTATION=
MSFSTYPSPMPSLCQQFIAEIKLGKHGDELRGLEKEA